jgi:hypothetical protein
MVDWSQCPLVESDPQRVHDGWVFRGTRLPVSIVFECLGNTPVPLRNSLQTSTVETTAERGWDRLTNGELLDTAKGGTCTPVEVTLP